MAPAPVLLLLSPVLNRAPHVQADDDDGDEYRGRDREDPGDHVARPVVASATPEIATPQASRSSQPTCGACAVAMEPTSATPRTPPTWRPLEAIAAAVPDCERGMPEMAVFVIGGLTRPKPRPSSAYPIASTRYEGRCPLKASTAAPAVIINPAPVSGMRAPERPTSRPASGAVIATIAVIGSVASPARRGPYPRDSCRYSVFRNRNPASTRNASTAIATAPLNGGERKKCGSTTGARLRSSTTRNDASRTAASTNNASVCHELQPARGPSMIAYVAQVSIAMRSSWPGTSIRRGLSAFDSGTSQRESESAATPIGMFTQKIERQPIVSVSAPPRTGPAAALAPKVPPHTPYAKARCFASVKTLVINESEFGLSIDPPIPCRTRNAISAPRLQASEHA